MNLKSKIATVATASFLTLSIVTGTVAQETKPTVTQEISANGSGYLTASIESGRLNPVKSSNTTQQNDGQLDLEVEDARGSNDGWNVTVSATNFQPASGMTAQAIPASGFRFMSAGDITPSIGSADNIHKAVQAVALDQSKRLMWAQDDFGTGKYTMPLNVQLDIPAQQAIGTYTSTLTVNVTAGPGQ